MQLNDIYTIGYCSKQCTMNTVYIPWVVIEHLLGSLAVMNIPVYNQYPCNKENVNIHKL